MRRDESSDSRFLALIRGHILFWAESEGANNAHVVLHARRRLAPPPGGHRAIAAFGFGAVQGTIGHAQNFGRRQTVSVVGGQANAYRHIGLLLDAHCPRFPRPVLATVPAANYEGGLLN